jgi:simple sugar transport system permease protein
MRSKTARLGLIVLAAAVGYGILTQVSPATATVVRDILTQPNTYSTGLRLAVPIVLAGLGGLLSEKSGLINIGLEGLLIMGAFTGIFAVSLIGTDMLFAVVPVKWAAVLIAVLITSLFSLLFGVVCIKYDADQIIAGLALWLIGLGLAPFIAVVYYGGPNSGGNVGTLGTWAVPLLSQLPFIGPILFVASPFVYIMFAMVLLVWILLYKTKYGRWIRASGENPDALETAGISVNRVRYGTTLLCGILSGLGGVSLSLGQVGLFIGSGETMVNGRGFIAIAAYLFGNYTPTGTLGAALFFGGLDGIQTQLQSLPAYDVPDQLVRSIPYIAVVLILIFVKKTRIPASAGENFRTDEE